MTRRTGTTEAGGSFLTTEVSGRVLTTDNTDGTDNGGRQHAFGILPGRLAGSFSELNPCHPCHPWLNVFHRI